LFQKVAFEVRVAYDAMLEVLPHSRKLAYGMADFESYLTRDKQGLQRVMEALVAH
jgi:hypothetical protein